MRPINEVIIHCSATPEGRDVTAADIRRWHVKGNGWSDIGYHYVIRLDGTVERGRSVAIVGAHCHGHNVGTIGVCYVGGLRNGKPADTRTEAQRAALEKLLRELVTTYSISSISGHHDYDAGKACPCFDAKAEYGVMVKGDG